MGKSTSVKVIAVNKKARFTYKILETLEAGLVLLGPEVKSMRANQVSFRDSYVAFRDDEAWLVNLHVGAYANAPQAEIDPDRRRKLLIAKRELRRLRAKIEEKGLALVPLRIYIRGKWMKVELGLGRGKRLYDKRDTIAERDAQRDMERAFKEGHR